MFELNTLYGLGVLTSHLHNESRSIVCELSHRTAVARHAFAAKSEMGCAYSLRKKNPQLILASL